MIHRRTDYWRAEGSRGRPEAIKLYRKHGISEATYYNRKAKFGGMTVSEAQRLKEREQESNKLKHLLAESMLDNATLKDLQSRK